MKTGVSITNFTYPGEPDTIREHLENIATYIDQNGFDSLWVMDHFFQLEPMIGKADEPMFEGYQMLAFLAAITKNVTLGTLVTGVQYRNPGFLMKQVSNLDVLSNGRAIFGIGAGWYERENIGYGFNFMTLKERFEMLEDTLKVAHQMLYKGDRSPFKGRHFEMGEPILSPMPIQKEMPIMVGGGGEKKTLKYVAEYGNMCNLFSSSAEDLPNLEHKLSVLGEHCKNAGRTLDDIEVTVLSVAHDVDANKLVEHAKALRERGVDHIIYAVRDIHTMEVLEELASDVLPKVKEL